MAFIIKKIEGELDMFEKVIVLIIILWCFIYTMSYAVWSFRKQKTKAALAIVILALTALIIPLWELIIQR